MTTKTYCDICGKDMGYGTHTDWRYNEIRTCARGAGSWDLCFKCSDKLKKHIKEMRDKK